MLLFTSRIYVSCEPEQPTLLPVVVYNTRYLLQQVSASTGCMSRERAPTRLYGTLWCVYDRVSGGPESWSRVGVRGTCSKSA